MLSPKFPGTVLYYKLCSFSFLFLLKQKKMRIKEKISYILNDKNNKRIRGVNHLESLLSKRYSHISNDYP